MLLKKLPLATAVAFSVSINAESNNRLEEIVVTGTKTEVALPKSLISVETFNEDDIEKLQIDDLTDLLKRAAGVEATNQGGRGSNGSWFIRGASSGHTLVLIDGVRVGSATLGLTAVEHLDPSQIKRIEVVKGPRSSLYGSDAIGGVVQIFTHRGEGDGGKIKMSIGSDNEKIAEVQLNRETETTRFNIAIRHQSTDGYDFTELQGNGNDDDEAYRNSGAHLGLSHDVSDTVTASAFYQYNEGKVEYDNGFVFDPAAVTEPFRLYEEEVFGVGVIMQVSDAWRTRLNLGYSKDWNREDDAIGNPYVSTFETEKFSSSFQNDITWAEDQILTIGVDHNRDEVDSSTTFSKDNDDTTGIFIQQQLVFQSHQLTFGIREDDFDSFGKEVTGSVNWGYSLSDDLMILASYGTGFKAPTVNQLYWPVGLFSSGNSDLNPEESESAEIALRGNFEVITFQVTAFQNEFDELIEWAPIYPADVFSPWQPDNIEKARVQGLEISVDTAVLGWDISLNATVQNPEDRLLDEQLRYRAKQFIHVDVDKQFGVWNLGFSVQGKSERFDDKFNNSELDGYATLDMRVGYAINDAAMLRLNLRNILDKEYQDRAGYIAEDFNASASLTIKF